MSPRAADVAASVANAVVSPRPLGGQWVCRTSPADAYVASHTKG